MYESYFTFRSMTLAQAAFSALTRQGLRSTLLRTPKKLSATGCGYAVRLGESDCFSAAAILRREGIAFTHCIRLYDNGQTEEVYP